MAQQNVVLFYPRLGWMDTFILDLPLSLVYVGDTCRKNGIEVRMFDQRVEGKAWKDKFLKLVDENTILAGFSCMTGSPITHALEATRLIKNYSPINRKYATELMWDINPNLLHDCTKILLGEHDFTSFCKAKAEVRNKICTIHTAEWEDMGEKYIFRIRANRFLQHMVRYLVGTILEVARGRFEVGDFKDLVDNSHTIAIAVRAPAQGLFLKQVYYE